MTGPPSSVPAGQPPPADLAARVFRAPYPALELRTVGTTCVATLKGAPWYAAPTLAEVARQISARAHPALPPPGPARPGDSRGPGA